MTAIAHAGTGAAAEPRPTSNATAAMRERVADAIQRGVGLRIIGAGTWLGAGRPVHASESLTTSDDAGITEYVPGDLTLTARAGTSLGEIRDATTAHGQWLALDPFGSDEGTLGATVATGSAGPLRTFFGSPRDLLLGVEFVTGAGVVARGGGRVVKNVAGFDLSRLFAGSWGTLGVITEVTLRLHARPEADESIAIAIDAATGPGRVRELLRRLPFVPYACEIANEPLARLIGCGDTVTALFRMGGNAEAVRAQRAALAELGSAREVNASVWQHLRAAEPEEAIVFRLSRLPIEIDATWADAAAIAASCSGTLVHAAPSRGVVRCIIPAEPTTDTTLAAAFGATSNATRIGERLPAELWELCSKTPVADRLSAGIKKTFDPHSILNYGILGEIV
ncbi:MAG TPA: FAD-binding protein [Gemmatimonadaceae bacterium]|nr:FAD-binding protein [Gemmatimonadaceae bacterium]